MTRLTEQEHFWESEFGNDYSDRNRGSDWIASNTALFSRVLSGAPGIQSVLELGSNIGLNLHAIRRLLPAAQLSAVEINQAAADELSHSLPDVDLHVTSILEFDRDHRAWDLVFTKGVLIHINPDSLPAVYDLMYACTSRYMLISEYYNPKPIEVDYRGHSGRLFKRDFVGEIMDRFADIALRDYGFVYHRDPNFPQDDMTWFLMEKKQDGTANS